MNSNLVGTYQIDKTSLKKNDDTLNLIIGSRAKSTITKPPNYLLFKHGEGKFSYLSSMYLISLESPKNDLRVYSIEYKQIDYLMSLDLNINVATIELNNTTKLINENNNIISSRSVSLV